MKKFVSLLLALIMALSIGVVGFAEDAKNTCPKCKEEFTSEATFNKHLVKCYDLATDAMQCPYEGCDAEFYSKTEYEKHIAADVCPYYVEKTVADELKEAFEKKDIKAIFEIIIDVVSDLLEKVDIKGLLGKIDLEGILGKVGDVVKDFAPKIIDAVKNLGK